MADLSYSALDVAAILSGMELSCRQESAIIDAIWRGECELLSEKYQSDQRKFILDVRYWITYFYEKPILDQEFPVVQKDISGTNRNLDETQFLSDFQDLDLFFKSIRLRILYGTSHDYVRIKLRTLLSVYDYRRRSAKLMEHLHTCLEFYRLEVFLRGGVPCELDTVDLDQMVIFRMKEHVQ